MTITNEKIICTFCKKPFKIIPQEKAFYQRKDLSIPEYCPACRHKMRMALRSERALYHRVCCYCNKDCLSTILETAPYKIACPDCFWLNAK